MKLSERTEVLRRIDKDIKTAEEHAKIAHEAADKLAAEAKAAQTDGKPIEMVKAAAQREWHLGAAMSWTSIKQSSISLRRYIEAMPIDDLPDPSEVVALPEAPTPPTAPEPSTLVDQAAAALGLTR
jgi:hypothetical protein